MTKVSELNLTEMCRKLVLAERANIVAYLRRRSAERMNIDRFDLLDRAIEDVAAGAHLRELVQLKPGERDERD